MNVRFGILNSCELYVLDNIYTKKSSSSSFFDFNLFKNKNRKYVFFYELSEKVRRCASKSVMTMMVVVMTVVALTMMAFIA